MNIRDTEETKLYNCYRLKETEFQNWGTLNDQKPGFLTIQDNDKVSEKTVIHLTNELFYKRKNTIFLFFFFLPYRIPTNIVKVCHMGYDRVATLRGLRMRLNSSLIQNHLAYIQPNSLVPSYNDAGPGTRGHVELEVRP